MLDHPLKQNQLTKAEFELTQTGRVMCKEQLQYFPQFGRFTLHDGDHIVVIEKVLEVIE
jgi:translation elongation factor EF-1alpha